MNTFQQTPLGISLNSQQIQDLLESAKEQDINQGGYCDARSGCVNFWCGPDNKPECWPMPTQGGLNYPRDYVGGLCWTLGEGTELTVDISPYALFDPPHQELSDETWNQCFQWCLNEVQKLLSKIGVVLPTDQTNKN